MNWQIFGHEPVKKILEKQMHSGIFSHAYLFSGPDAVGKKSLAFEFAKNILNAEKLENHPDFQLLDLEGEIKLEQVLEFIAKLAYKPFMGLKKISVINNAQNLNLQSSNALLKTLEEPSGSSIIILVAESGKVLPTIASRCQVLNFNLLSKAAVLRFAENSNLKINGQMLNLCFGRIGRLNKFLFNNNFFEQEKESVNQYLEITKQSLGEKINSVSKFAELEDVVLENSLLTWFYWQAQELHNSAKDFTKVQALKEAFINLKKNYNKKLVLQGLFTKI